MAKKYVFVTLEFPPLEYMTKDKKADGAVVKIVREVMKELKHEVEIQVMPWSRAIKKVKSGEVHGIFTIYKNKERLEFLDFSDAILIPQDIVLYLKKDSKIVYDGNLKTLKSKTIGTIAGISYGQQFDQAIKNIPLKIKRVEQIELNFSKLILGRVDVVISNKFSGDHVIKKMKIQEEIKFGKIRVDRTPSYIAFSKKHELTKLSKEFSRVLRKMKADGRYSKTLSEFGIELSINKANPTYKSVRPN